MTEIFGRETELARAEAFLDFDAEQPRVLVFEGESGIGKTTLWRASIGRARDRGLHVLETRPAEAERTLSYAGLADLLAGLHDGIARLPGPQRRALRIALLLDEPSGEPPEPRAIAAGLLGLLRRLARDTPVVAGIDDLQWLDRASHAALRFALRRLNGERVRLLAASRTSDADLEDALRIAVQPLELRALDELVTTRLGVQLLRPTLRRLEEASGGNPFYALEIAAGLVRSGQGLELGEPLPVPPSLQDLVHARLVALSPAARRAALATAALPQPATSLIERAVGERALGEAVAAHVLETADEEVRFTHPLLASTIHGDASLEERRALHQRLADFVHDPEQRALLVASVAEGPNEDLAAVVEAAAMRAAARGAADSGAALARRAVELTPQTHLEDGHRRVLLWARFTAAAGDPKRAEEQLTEQLERVEGGRARAEVWFELGNVRLTRRGNTAARLCYEKALEELGAAREHDQLQLLILLELAIAHAGELRYDSDVTERALALAERVGTPDLLSRAFGLHAMRPTVHGETLDDSYWERALEAEKQAGALRYGGPSHALALYAFSAGDFETGALRLGELAESMRARGDSELPWVLQDLSDIARAGGAWDLGEQLADEAYEYVVQTGKDSLEPQCLLYRARFALLRGELDSARERTLSALTLLEQLESEEGALAAWDGPLWEGLAWSLLGRIAAASGAHAEAHEWYSRDLGRLRELAAAISPARWWLAESLANDIASLVALGDLGSAAAELEELVTRAAELPPTMHALLARSQGLVAAAQRRPAEAREHLERSLEVLDAEESPWLFEIGCTLLALGTVLRSERRKTAARETLERALGIFERLGARLWAEKARRELAQISGRTSRPGALTATEERIAELVAAGRSNAEVAHELFLSPKTVEWNLSKVYKKLHVRSRTELAAKLAKRTQLARSS